MPGPVSSMRTSMPSCSRPSPLAERDRTSTRSVPPFAPMPSKAFCTSSVRLRLIQVAVGLGERLSEFLIALRLSSDLNNESVHQHSGQEEEKDADREQAVTLGCNFILLKGRVQVRTIRS